MSEERSNTGCQDHAENLVLYLYDELAQPERAATEAHLGVCGECREELRSSRDALQTIDAARLKEMTTYQLPAWDDVEDEIITSLPPLPVPARPQHFSALAKAASIVLLAGAAFLAGRQWDSIGAIVTTGPSSRESTPANPLAGADAAPLPVAASPGDRMRAFSERTHGYFQRSRLVLLEFANADQITDTTMRAASRNLLREAPTARRVAGQIHDERIEDLVTALEQVLTRIAANGLTAEERVALRVDVEDVIARLELTAPSERIAQERART